MKKPEIPVDESKRVESLKKMHILSTPREADLDRVTETARRIFDVDIALVSLVDTHRQWFMSKSGLSQSETSRDVSFCAHAIHQDAAFVVEDASLDERFQDNPLVVGDPHIRFYAGKPIKNEEGFRIGTLCLIGSTPRTITQKEVSILEDLARFAEIILNHRQMGDTQRALLQSLVEAQRDKLIDPLTGIWNRRGLEQLFDREIARCVRDGVPLAVAMIDIDNFKMINDKYGHVAGDEVIKKVAGLLLLSARTTDIAARYGGEEFIVVAPGVKQEHLVDFGNKLVSFIEEHGTLEFVDKSFRFTVSIGLSCSLPQSNDPSLESRLIDAADSALYAAKQAGKNCAREHA